MGIAPLLSEAARDLIQEDLKLRINQSLADIRAAWPNAIVSTEPPRSYFIYPTAHTYQCPAVFFVVDSMSFPEETNNPNHINAVLKMFVSVVVEDRDARLLTIKAERYHAALFQCLHRIQIEDPAKNIKIYSRVVRTQYSEIFTKKAREGEGMFRKEVFLELEINHWENPSSY